MFGHYGVECLLRTSQATILMISGGLETSRTLLSGQQCRWEKPTRLCDELRITVVEYIERIIYEDVANTEPNKCTGPDIGST